ncbi:uncharacterized protein LOC126792402 [Argentina anserina]|uniref:uncharacterized protein LOC126792402 n=1 Tax=Argentina anserina TaxID=57926 RepID=UPI0021763C53|nr:uncharacterized protein LOC126792402 [Potentilla anserina]
MQRCGSNNSDSRARCPTTSDFTTLSSWRVDATKSYKAGAAATSLLRKWNNSEDSALQSSSSKETQTSPVPPSLCGSIVNISYPFLPKGYAGYATCCSDAAWNSNHQQHSYPLNSSRKNGKIHILVMISGRGRKKKNAFSNVVVATGSISAKKPIWPPGTCSTLAHFPIPIKFSGRASYDPNKKSLNNIRINSTFTKVDMAITLTSVASVTDNGYSSHEQQVRQNIPTTKQFVDHYREAMIIEGGVGYSQRVVIRSYEDSPDKTATLESILNLLQEIASNHMQMSGLHRDGFGATHGMIKNDLIWVMSRMPPVQVDCYPKWGEALQIDTWLGAAGKNGMRRDWLIRSEATRDVYARATSTWVLMNQKTNRLSKMPEEVRAEIAPWFIEKQAMPEDVVENIVKLDSQAKYINNDLKPKRSDLDMHHHVNNVKYVRWMLETIPDQILKAHQLTSIVLEYIRKCESTDIVQSLCQPDKDGILRDGLKQEKNRPDEAGVLKDGLKEERITSLLNAVFLGEYKDSTAFRIILLFVGISLGALSAVALIVVVLMFWIRSLM